VGRLKFELWLKQHKCELLTQRALTLRYINTKTGQTSTFSKVRILRFDTVIDVCADLGIPAPPQVIARRRGVRGARLVLRRKLHV